MTHHRIAAGPDTIHWGWFEAGLEPVLTIDSGDRVTVESVSGGPANLPGEGFHVPPELYAIHERAQRKLPGHILTGPIAVRGAMPGDVLEIRILDIRLRQDWGYTFVRPLAGALPNDFATGEQMIVALDRERQFILAHAVAVVRDDDGRAAAVADRYVDTGSAGIDGIFDELLDG